MGALADDLNKPTQIRNLGRINTAISYLAQRKKEAERLAALQEYLTPQTELTPETKSSMQQVESARNIAVEPRQMNPSMNEMGPPNPLPSAEMELQRPQTMTRQRSLMEANPEEMESFGLSSGDILGARMGQETQGRKLASDIALEQAKGGMDTARQLAIETARGAAGIALEQEKAKTRRPHLDEFQHYLDANGGDQQKARKQMIEDRMKLKTSGFYRPKVDKFSLYLDVYGDKKEALRQMHADDIELKRVGAQRQQDDMEKFFKSIGIAVKSGEEKPGDITREEKGKTSRERTRRDTVKKILDEQGKKSDDKAIDKFLAKYPDFQAGK